MFVTGHSNLLFVLCNRKIFLKYYEVNSINNEYKYVPEMLSLQGLYGLWLKVLQKEGINRKKAQHNFSC